MEIKFLEKAIEISRISIEKGGGPFGACVVRDNEIISLEHNTVTIDNDPTAHAEINAIRSAAKKLGKFDLSDCVIYSSTEPCPMCLSAIYWARIPIVYFATTRKDAEQIGFSDNYIYEELQKPIDERKVKMIQLDKTKSLEVFEVWKNYENKVEY